MNSPDISFPTFGGAQSGTWDTSLALAIVAQSDDAIFATSPDGRVLTWNAGAERMFGYSAAEIADLSIDALIPTSLLDEHAELMTRLFDGLSVSHFETQRLRKDGSLADVSLSLSSIRDAEGQVVAFSTIARDIAELKRVQQEHAQLTSDLRTILDHSPGMISSWSGDRTNRFVNKAYARAIGKSEDEIRGRHSREIIGEAHYERVKSLVDAAQSGTPQSFEMEVSLPDGGVRYDQIDYIPDPNSPPGSPPGLFVFRNDVTRHKGAELASRLTAERFRFLYEATPAMMHSIDGDGRLLSVSDTWLQKLGYAREEVLGRRSTEFLSPESRERANAEVLPEFFRTGRVDDVEYQMTKKDGSVVDVLMSAVSERASDGRFLRSLAVMEDITARKRAERELRESEAILDRAGRIAGVGGWALDLLAGELTWTDQTCRIHDLPEGHRPTLEEAIGYYDVEARGVIESAVRECIEARRHFDLELRLVTARGRAVWVRALGEPVVENDQVVRVFGSFQDVTERRAADDAVRESREKLRASEASLRLVVDNIPALVAYVGADYRYRFCNRLYEEWYGLPAEKIVGSTIREVVGDRNYTGLERGLARVFAGEATQFEGGIATRSGLRWVDARMIPHGDPDGSIVGCYVFVMDRSEERRAELDLEDSEQRLRTVIEHVPAMIGYWAPDGRCVFGNRLYEEWFGIASGRLPGMSPGEIIGQEQFTLSKGHFEEALHGIPQQFERAFVDARGVARRTQVTFLPDIVGGEQRGMFSFAYDVTELNRMVDERTRELTAAKEAAERASRVKDEIISNVSHEMRTPLHGIVGFSKLGVTRIAPESIEKCRSYFERILASGERLTRYVDQILDLARLTSGEKVPRFVPTDLDELVGKVGVDMQILFDEKELTFRTLSTVERPLADVDGAMIERVVLNLLSNAKKFSPRGGMVTVTLSNGCIDQGDGEEAPALKLTIDDDGPGIPPDELDAIFDPFVQSSRTDERAGGTGLGLSIARRIVELHGGAIRAANRASGGARFEVVFPVRARGAAVAMTVPRPAVGPEAVVPLAG